MSGPSDLESDIDGIVSSDPGGPGDSDDPVQRSVRDLEDDIAKIRGSEAGLRFEAKRESRREGLERASAQAGAESASAFGTAHRVGDRIPMGQPILRGHHSESRHRRDIQRIDTAMRQGIEANRRSKDLARRASSVGSAGISGDDPAASQELQLKLVRLEEAQERMKAANLAIRKHAKAGPDAQLQALAGLGFSEDEARRILAPDFAKRVGFPAYTLSNNSAEISRVKKRIAELGDRASAPAREPIHGSVEGIEFSISEDKELNRTQIRFSEKPSDALRKRLRSAGFIWAPSADAWQRRLSNQAWHNAGYALGIAMT